VVRWRYGRISVYVRKRNYNNLNPNFEIVRVLILIVEVERRNKMNSGEVGGEGEVSIRTHRV